MNDEMLSVEFSLIGSIMVAPDDVMPLTGELTGEDFENIGLGCVFTACKNLFNEGRPIDAISVFQFLGEDYKIPIARSLEYALPSNAGEYARLVREGSARRKAAIVASELIGNLSASIPLTDCAALAESIPSLLALNSGEEMDAYKGLLRACGEAMEEQNYITLGFKKLDERLMVAQGDFVVIGARPSVGKTAFAIQVAQHISRSRRVVFYSLETSCRKMYQRLLSFLTGTSFSDINHGRVDKDLTDAIEKAGGSTLKLHVVNASGWTVQQIAADAIRRRAQVIFIDYLGLVRGGGNSIYEKATGVSNDLHTFTQKHNVAVFALSQLNRERGEVSMANLRDSGAIEQDADAILMLSRESEDESSGLRTLSIQKTKTGTCCNDLLNFDGDKQRFYEVERY